jgi:hypothetical protein
MANVYNFDTKAINLGRSGDLNPGFLAQKK